MGPVFRTEITVGYEDEGSGEPLLLVHGHPFNRSMWRPQIEHLSRAGWRVIAPDLRGYGESTVVPGTTPLATFARDLLALLDHLGIERCVLGGLSMGGQIVMECWRHFPERIRAVVLADTFAAAETTEGRAARHAMAERLVHEGMTGYAREVLAKMVAPHHLASHPEVAAHVMEMMTSTAPEGAAAALRGRAERPDYTAQLSQMPVPALVVVGTEDTYTPVSDAREIQVRMPDARLVLIERAAHLPNLERPEEFNAALEDFLRSLPADAAADTPGTPGGPA
ncbi:pimeloyl-ACP methyl ester carboxylesterase [Streptomyces sp. 2333.5]|uniref:alpha/beta fold hydrolase n=1 Tax=unclassified Streptomyces TaxID=2593676 RepID=UPI00089586EC|nr:MULTISPECIES: alpha/beta fold hydrolase [unclassified Streptomyces]PJJ05431.1 pimeloyl-ACP methyl ester carboxylesterase [Streptomyces sp. 2333.5]SEE75739.1 Pimeloyl-ACP methyl ester carboxylesterase [Streptomyces sp. 2314.4]SEE99024.1 Pimeloyl-ACP methyl ester carboxylesterase [Streptomyces sp. 2112.2]